MKVFSLLIACTLITFCDASYAIGHQNNVIGRNNAHLLNAHYRASSLFLASDTSISSLIDSVQRNGFPLIKYFPPNYVTNGSVDYTLFVQKAVDSHSLVIFPPFPILVHAPGINIPSNRVIYFPPGSAIKIGPNKELQYAILSLKGVHNVVLINPKVIGDRFKHLGSSGEWGMGINISSSNDISIYNPIAVTCWGDGIYIGQNSSTPPKHIVIYDANCNNNRRNGISIISGINISLINPTCSYNDGTSPEAGIDIEPNSPINEITGIIIQNPLTEHNGIGIALAIVRNYTDKQQKVIGIQIINHKDIASKIGFSIVCRKPNQYKGMTGLYSFGGHITIYHPEWVENSILPFKATDVNDSTIPSVTLQDPTIQINGKKVDLIKGKYIIIKKNINPKSLSKFHIGY